MKFKKQNKTKKLTDCYGMQGRMKTMGRNDCKGEKSFQSHIFTTVARYHHIAPHAQCCNAIVVHRQSPLTSWLDGYIINCGGEPLIICSHKRLPLSGDGRLIVEMRNEFLKVKYTLWDKCLHFPTREGSIKWPQSKKGENINCCLLYVVSNVYRVPWGRDLSIWRVLFYKLRFSIVK